MSSSSPASDKTETAYFRTSVFVKVGDNSSSAEAGSIGAHWYINSIEAFASSASAQSTHFRNLVSASDSARKEKRNFHSRALYSAPSTRVGGKRIAAARLRFSFPFGFRSWSTTPRATLRVSF